MIQPGRRGRWQMHGVREIDVTSPEEGLDYSSLEGSRCRLLFPSPQRLRSALDRERGIASGRRADCDVVIIRGVVVVDRRGGRGQLALGHAKDDGTTTTTTTDDTTTFRTADVLEYDILAPLGGIRPVHFVFVLRRLLAGKDNLRDDNERRYSRRCRRPPLPAPR